MRNRCHIPVGKRRQAERLSPSATATVRSHSSPNSLALQASHASETDSSSPAAAPLASHGDLSWAEIICHSSQVCSLARRTHDEGAGSHPEQRVLVPINSGVDRVNRDAEQPDDEPLPGLTLQCVPPLENLHAQASGTLAIDPSTNCLVLRSPASRLVDGVIVTEDEFVDVAWPPGWRIALRDDGPALIDAAGRAVGQLRDKVSVGGGFVETAVANVTSCTGQSGSS